MLIQDKRFRAVQHIPQIVRYAVGTMTNWNERSWHPKVALMVEAAGRECTLSTLTLEKEQWNSLNNYFRGVGVRVTRHYVFIITT